MSGVIRLPGPVTAAIFALFGLALLVFVGDLVRRALSKEKGQGGHEPAQEPNRVPPWLRRMTMILSLVNAAVLAYLWRRAVLDGGLFSGVGGLASGLPLPGVDPGSAPAIFNWVFGGLALAAGLGALGLALWVALADRPARDEEEPAGAAPAGPLEAAVDESLEDLRAESDPRRAIVRCYARFERAAADSGHARAALAHPVRVHARGPRPPVPSARGGADAHRPVRAGPVQPPRAGAAGAGPRGRRSARDPAGDGGEEGDAGAD